MTIEELNRELNLLNSSWEAVDSVLSYNIIKVLPTDSFQIIYSAKTLEELSGFVNGIKFVLNNLAKQALGVEND